MHRLAYSSARCLLRDVLLASHGPRQTYWPDGAFTHLTVHEQDFSHGVPLLYCSSMVAATLGVPGVWSWPDSVLPRAHPEKPSSVIAAVSHAGCCRRLPCRQRSATWPCSSEIAETTVAHNERRGNRPHLTVAETSVLYAGLQHSSAKVHM